MSLTLWMVAASSRAMQVRWRTKMAASKTNMTDGERKHRGMNFALDTSTAARVNPPTGCVCVCVFSRYE